MSVMIDYKCVLSDICWKFHLPQVFGKLGEI